MSSVSNRPGLELPIFAAHWKSTGCVLELASQSEQERLMKDGFLGYPTSFMLDFVVCALVVLVPLLVFSLWVVKVRKSFTLHRNLQVLLAGVLFVAVGAFEVDMQWVQGGWEKVMSKQLEAIEGIPSDTQIAAHQARSDRARRVLHIHLVFAVSTPILWLVTLVLALRRFPKPPVPGQHTKLHKSLGWGSTLALVATSVTGVWFYYVAFVQ